MASEDAPADFGVLFGDLNPAEPPAEIAAPEPGAFCLPGLGLPFQPPPVVMEPIPSFAGEGEDAPVALTDAEAESDICGGIWAERPATRADWADREPTPANVGPESGKPADRPPGSSPGLTPEKPAATGQSAEPAGKRATETPRFDGLPATALEHRQAAGLPPGLERLQRLPAATSPDEFPETAEPRGSVATKSDHPGDIARSALEAAGSRADETTPPSDRALRVEELLANRRAGRVPLPEEKFAAPVDPAGPRADEEVRSRKKSFLGAGEEMVASRVQPFGIDGAKPGVTMPPTSFNAPPTHPNSDYAMTAVTSATTAVPGAAALAEAGDSFRSAHEAVEVVLHAVEHVASQAQKSVQLKFSVGGEELAVRVELRADEVRTTFRTDSAELRSALAQEWQQVSNGSTQTDRPVRIAPAVFAAAEQSALNAFAGDTSSRGRHAGTPRDEAARLVAGVRGRAVAAAAHPVALPTMAAPIRSGASHRLHTLA